MSDGFARFSLSLCLFCCCLLSTHAENGIPVESEAAAPILSAIHSEQLRRIMANLNVLTYEREYTELELDRLRAEQIESLAVEAGILAARAGRLPELLTEGKLGAEEQITFIAIAQQLQAETLPAPATDLQCLPQTVSR
ncbi:MAG: hypothetical protein HW386_2403 [Gammaproteobacteria bacterium]|nr:hypothetical protein [Gammaproteobacteria bacterium]